ncbi:response regulator [Spirochaeta isovalerica]|uniref:CheY-like chemotaxis protein n=1 Tax=Spirochaeta isovalerica TaxID=150 RepID=A0A841R6I6_9SPIO|nr:response regulator [Spirochaeta isovalerica]MBB6478609.1 CheY-like chemotaxis protein [Spirochaeta isovalerica]
MKIKRILILEDDAFQRRFLQLFLEAAGFSVEYGTNGLEGLKKLRESTPFDLIMSDLKMPGMDGIEFLIEMRKEKKFHAIPFVMISKVDNKVIKQKAEELGAYHFMDKPFTNEKITRLLSELEQKNNDNS